MTYFVSRQNYWPDDEYVVEIAAGGINYANADMLGTKYPGEGQEYEDPREAVEAALEIYQKWQADCPDKEITVAHGYTGGMTMPFEGDTDFDALRKWAEETYDELEKCPTCGKVMEGAREWYQAGDYFDNDFDPYQDGDKYCSEYCAEKGSNYICSNSECGNTYPWEERHKLQKSGYEEYLCPICRLTPCKTCNGLRESHWRQEDDEYEPMEFRVNLHEVRCWVKTYDGGHKDNYTYAIKLPNGEYGYISGAAQWIGQGDPIPEPDLDMEKALEGDLLRLGYTPCHLDDIPEPVLFKVLIWMTK